MGVLYMCVYVFKTHPLASEVEKLCVGRPCGRFEMNGEMSTLCMCGVCVYVCAV